MPHDIAPSAFDVEDSGWTMNEQPRTMSRMPVFFGGMHERYGIRYEKADGWSPALGV